MLYHAKNKTIALGDTTMDYITFGTGKKPLVLIPGLGDGLSTIKGKAIPFALAYGAYTKNHTVYVFSRKNHMSPGYATKDMAKDLAAVMQTLGISKADIVGISQGGMIAQYLSIDFPSLVNKLVLAVTLAKQNPTIQAVVLNWINLAKRRDYKALVIDIMEKSYSAKALKKYRLLYPLLGYVKKPKDFTRFLIQANACIQHNAYNELDKIQCPTLVIGGNNDQIVASSSFAEIATKIQHSELFVFAGFGHAVYEEAKSFHDRIFNFLKD